MLRTFFFGIRDEFSLVATGRWGKHSAKVRVIHTERQGEKTRAEMAVLLANIIVHARRHYGFTKDEVMKWQAWEME